MMERIILRAGIALLLVLLTGVLVPLMLLHEVIRTATEYLTDLWEALDYELNIREKK